MMKQSPNRNTMTSCILEKEWCSQQVKDFFFFFTKLSNNCWLADSLSNSLASSTLTG
uniref:Uncharacterized protein n=1 Tax=Arundo donax TaxID=35708 RepID=A0A0A9D426_ARUDO